MTTKKELLKMLEPLKDDDEIKVQDDCSHKSEIYIEPYDDYYVIVGDY